MNRVSDTARIALERAGPAVEVWRRRIAILGGAVLLGLVALLFAKGADGANRLFTKLAAGHWLVPLLITPAGFMILAWITVRVAPAARGSGIPQAIAFTRDPDRTAPTLISLRTAVTKFMLTLGALGCGASVGREGPTVQISAAIMAWTHRLMRVPVGRSAIIAGGAAGVSAAFNTPLAGVAFAIEELAGAYEQRTTLLVMTAVLIAGMVSLGIAGDYVYFGAMRSTLPLSAALVAAPVAGVIGGAVGGLFSRTLLTLSGHPLVRSRPLLWAGGCGLLVAVIGIATGTSWGTGYEAARAMIEGAEAPLWFGPAKLLTTLATALSGLPGGIFAPSLATGAGVGNLLRLLFPDDPAGAIVLLGMIAYFTGVVRAPLTAVVIIIEVTASRGMVLPLFATAVIADGAARLVCPTRLYHGLAAAFAPSSKPERDRA